MKKETNFLEAVGTLVIALVLGTLTQLYAIWLILKIVKWYNVPIQLNTAQWFGIAAILGVLTLKKDQKDKDDKDPMITVIGDVIMKAVFITFALGVYLIAKFIFA